MLGFEVKGGRVEGQDSTLTTLRRIFGFELKGERMEGQDNTLTTLPNRIFGFEVKGERVEGLVPYADMLVGGRW